MNTNTPYQAPDSEIIDPANLEYADIEIFSTSQRIGRVRYLAYNFIASFASLFVVGIAAALLIPALSGDGSTSVKATMGIIAFVLYLVPIVISFILARRRLHDLNKTGWLGLLFLIPLVNLFLALYLLFAPGSEAANQYGAKPTPNTALTWIAGLIAPIFLIGILAAIAIPAYQDYVERAKAAQVQQP